MVRSSSASSDDRVYTASRNLHKHSGWHLRERFEAIARHENQRGRATVVGGADHIDLICEALGEHTVGHLCAGKPSGNASPPVQDEHVAAWPSGVPRELHRRSAASQQDESVAQGPAQPVRTGSVREVVRENPEHDLYTPVPFLRQLGARGVHRMTGQEAAHHPREKPCAVHHGVRSRAMVVAATTTIADTAMTRRRCPSIRSTPVKATAAAVSTSSWPSSMPMLKPSR